MRCKGAPEVNLLHRTCGRMKALSKQALLWNVPCLWLLIPAHRTHTKQGQQMAKTLRSWSTRCLISRSCCWGGKGRSRIRRQPPLQRAQQTKSRNKQTNKPQGLAMFCHNENEVKGGRSPPPLQKHSRLRGHCLPSPPQHCQPQTAHAEPLKKPRSSCHFSPDFSS